MQCSRWWLVVAVLVGCSSSKAPPQPEAGKQETGKPEAIKPAEGSNKPAQPAQTAPAPAVPAAPPVELVLADERKLRFVGLEAGTLVERRALEAPERIAGMAWAGRELVVLLGDASWDPIEDAYAASRVTVGVVTASGIDVIRQPPSKTWDLPRPADPELEKLQPQWKLRSSRSEIWLGRCVWGHPGAHSDDQCTEWVYVRLRPTPPVSTRKPPVVETYPEQVLAGPADYQLELVDGPPATSGPRPRYVRCTHRGTSTVLRGGDPTEIIQLVELRWLSTAPPRFQARNNYGNARDWWRTFEGCAEPKEQVFVRRQLGPAGFAALILDEGIAITWQGRDVAMIKDAGQLSFVPPS